MAIDRRGLGMCPSLPGFACFSEHFPTVISERNGILLCFEYETYFGCVPRQGLSQDIFIFRGGLLYRCVSSKLALSYEWSSFSCPVRFCLHFVGSFPWWVCLLAWHCLINTRYSFRCIGIWQLVTAQGYNKRVHAPFSPPPVIYFSSTKIAESWFKPWCFVRLTSF